MADPKKISELTTAGPLTGVELVPIVQNSGTLQTTVSAIGIFATSAVSNDLAAISTRLDVVSAAVSVNSAQIAVVSALTSVNAAAITSINAVVSALEVRVSAVSAAAVSLGTALTSTNNVVSVLADRVAAVSASVSALQIQINTVSAALTSTNNVVSALEIRVSAASATGVANAAAITSVNNVVSALEIRVSAASATGVTNAAAITSINNVVSALEIRVSAASATGAANSAAITSINNVVSVLDVRLTAVSASVSVLNVQMLAVQASISAINSALAAIDASALAALEPRVSALEIRVAAVSASVSALQVQVDAVSVLTSLNTAAITSVNAVVSLKAFRDGDHLTNVQYIDFNTTTSYAPIPGRLTWDINSGTLDLGLTGTVNLLIGQRTVAQIYNNSGVTLPKDKAVRVTGAQGQRLTGALAQADSDANSATIFGIMLETVSVNRSGYVATDGLIRNVNTLGYSDGDIVYLSPVSAGELTPIKPVAPQHLVQMGYIVNGGSGGAGEIYVKVQNGYELGELHDVKISASSSIANNEVLAYNTSAGVWTNSTVLIEAQASISALQIQLNAVSAAVSVNTVAINAVSAAVSLRVLRAGDTMTGQLAIAVAANTIGVSVSGGLVVTSVVNFTGDSALLLHSGTTATRPTSATPGLIRFNSGSNTFEGYTSATWGAIGGGGGATGGGTNQAFYLNDTVVSVSYSIPSGKNAGTFGPVTIATGVTVEVPSGSTWTVV